MGDMREVFDDMRAERAERRQGLEPKRFKYAQDKFDEHGIEWRKDSSDPSLMLVDGYIRFWAFTGLYSGAGLGSGRGIHNLIKAIEQKGN